MERMNLRAKHWKFKAFGLGLIVAFQFGCSSSSHHHTLPATDHDFMVIAHRGDHENGIPENTIAAYEQAIQHHADYVEVDLRTTSDGHFVIMHDPSVDRMTTGKGNVGELTYDYIRSLKIAGKQDFKNKTYRVPNFEEVLKACQGRINIYLDFKTGNNVREAYQLIKKWDMQHQVVVYLNAKEQYGKWRNIAPEVPLMASIPEEMGLESLDSLLDKYAINIVDNAYQKGTIDFLHHRGIAVWTDVESENEGPEIWQKMIDLGVDGLQTDHPEELIHYLIRKGGRSNESP